MKSEHISEAIGLLDDALIEEAEEEKRTVTPRRVWLGVIAAAACVAITVGLVWGSGGFAAVEPGPDESAAESMAATTAAATVTVTTTTPSTTEAVTQPPQATTAAATATSSAAKPNQSFGGTATSSTAAPALDAFIPTYATNTMCVKAAATPVSMAGHAVYAHYTEGFTAYAQELMTQFLGSAGNENRVCSPVNLYMALAMLAETTGGNSRVQLLDLLHTKDIGELRKKTHALWSEYYQQTPAFVSIPGTSIWLNRDLVYHTDTIRRLADTYHTTTFCGQMGSAAYDSLLQEWLNTHTGGLLKDAVDNKRFDTQTVLALCSTLYYEAQWENWFSESNNTTGLFHAPSGEREVTYMHYKEALMPYYQGENFTAVGLSLLQSGYMWLILPKEGMQAATLFADPEVYDMMSRSMFGENGARTVKVNLALPKFDVYSDTDMKAELIALGITDIFNSKADFSPLTETENVTVTEIGHSVRVKAEEKGVSAAALTDIFLAGCPLVEEIVDFNLDRPFVFIIDKGDTFPFAGVVNTP